MERRAFLKIALLTVPIAMMPSAACKDNSDPKSSNNEPSQGQLSEVSSTVECPEFIPQEKERAWEEFKSGWERYKTSFITPIGAGNNNEFLRVIMPEPGEESNPKLDRSTSESTGYGMVFAVHANDKDTFDKLWQYAKSHLVKSYGLMHWNVDSNNQWTVGEGESAGPASDADIDMAYSLIAAGQQWKQKNYLDDARKLVDNIMTHEVDRSDFTIKLSPVWGGSERTSPDRFDPQAFLIFQSFSGDSNWGGVAKATTTIIGSFLEKNPNAVLLPEWLNANGEAIPPEGGGDIIHGYDATRYPIRLAKSFSQLCDPQIRKLFEKENSFYQALQNPTNIVDGYTIEGQPTGQYRGVNSFVVGAYIASAASRDPVYRKQTAEITNQMANEVDMSYFSQSTYLYSRLVSSGMMLKPDQIEPYAS